MSADAPKHPDPALPLTSEDTKVPTNLPTDPDMSGAASKDVSSKDLSVRSISSDPKALGSKADELITRVSKLIRTTAGLGSTLSTLSYTLYILAYLDINAPSRARIIEQISLYIGRTPEKVAPGALKPVNPISRFAPWIGLLNDTRFAIRLTGLIPMYFMAKNLVNNPPKDQYLRTLARIQVPAYVTFQVLENVWFLGGKGLLSPTTLNRFGGAGAAMQNSCRAWLVAIICDFLRLAREAQLTRESKSSGEKQLTTQEQEAKDQQWYSSLFVSSCWLPMAIHYSLTGGIGMNTGMVGLSGMLAGSGNMQKLWMATKE